MVVKRPMVAFLCQLLLAIRSRFARRARLEAENLILRQQLVVVLSQNLNPDVLVMQPTEDWYCCDGAELLLAPKIRRILVQ
jgi:hypothetical protein